MSVDLVDELAEMALGLTSEELDQLIAVLQEQLEKDEQEKPESKFVVTENKEI